MCVLLPRRGYEPYPILVSRDRGRSWKSISNDLPARGSTYTFAEDHVSANFSDLFADMVEELRQLVDVDLPHLEDRLEDAGVPWTPGRGVPRWP